MRIVNIVGYISIALAFVVHYWIGHGKEWEPIATFILAGFGVIPLAHLMGHATESLSVKVGPTWGGLLNATFGNAAELIIAIIALSKGLNEIVKASLTGSILGNLLLVGGASMVAGGWKRERQKFNIAAAESNAGLLTIAVAAMLAPAIFHFTAERAHDAQIVAHEHSVSIATSVVLLVIYALALLFTLRTHAHVLSRPPEKAPPKSRGTDVRDSSHESAHGGGDSEAIWTVKFSVIMLLLASAGIGIVAELLVGSAEQVGHKLGWNQIFVGVIVLAIVGNAAEHSTAILMALRDDMDTAMTIVYQSSLQIALFAVPALVFISSIMAYFAIGKSTPLDLVFSPMEIVGIMLAVSTVVVLGLNGETNWFEGALLLGLYAILGVAFFYLPESVAGVAGEAGVPTTLPMAMPGPVPAGH